MNGAQISDIAPWVERLTKDEVWRQGLDPDEQRLCSALMIDTLILAKQRGWDLERMYARTFGAIRVFAGFAETTER
jgi:hypothetical protein